MNLIRKVNPNNMEWEEFRQNAYIKNLTEQGLKVNLIKLAPNSTFDEHLHEATEWLYIIEGEYSDAYGNYTKGDFVINEKGSSHSTKSGKNGCVVLAIKSI
jgi:anti-sigma factor ChrR (cupin superfamily)